MMKKTLISTVIFSAVLASALFLSPAGELSPDALSPLLGYTLFTWLFSVLGMIILFAAKRRPPSFRQLSGAVILNVALSPFLYALSFYGVSENYGGIWGRWLFSQFPFSPLFNSAFLIVLLVISINWLFNSSKIFPFNLLLTPLISKLAVLAEKSYSKLWEAVDRWQREIQKRKLQVKFQTQPPPQIFLSQPPELPQLQLEPDTTTKPPKLDISKLPSILKPELHKPFSPYTEVTLPAILHQDTEILSSPPAEQHTLRSKSRCDLEGQMAPSPSSPTHSSAILGTENGPSSIGEMDTEEDVHHTLKTEPGEGKFQGHKSTSGSDESQ